MHNSSNRLQFFRKALVLALVFSQLAPASAFAIGDLFPNPCPGLFKKILPKRVAKNPDQYLDLSKKPIADFFPESEIVHPLPGTEMLGAKVTPESLRKFHEEFDTLLDQRAKIFDFPAKSYRKLLKAKYGQPYPEIDPVLIEGAFKAKGLNLEDVQNIYFVKVAPKSKQLSDYLKFLSIKKVAALGVTVVIGVGSFMGSALKGAVVAGPVAGVVNAFLSAPLKPVLESSEQSSNIIFAGPAQAIQKFAAEKIGQLKESVSELANTTEALDQYNFEGMDHKEAKKIMDGFEERYYKIFLRVSGFMPPYKRSGRDVIRDWLISQPLMMANHASTFSMEYTMNKSLLSALEDKIKARGTPATSEEQLQLEEHRENMENAENRLAVTLASWKLLTFAFAEVARDPQAAEANGVLMNTLGRYEKFMNMDKYRKELSTKVKEAFHNFDPSFTGLDQLQRPAGKE
jgi:hypothetical protein